ncbi:CsgG/HfaB family protein [Aquifex pyrophilus]
MKTREPELPKCDKPLGTIVAKGFKCKAAACVGDRLVFGPNYTVEVSPTVLGEGLSDMLVTALVQTGCFKVLERETLQEIKEELELMGVQPKQTLKGADFLLTGAVTALEMNAAGIGGGGVIIPLPFIGGAGVKAGKQKAHIALDLRVVRVRDAEILLAKAVEGKSERWKFGVGGGGIFGTTIAGGWFEAFKNTPMEEATRDLIYHAVKLIVSELKQYGPVSQEVSYPAKSVEKKEVGSVPSATGLKRATVIFRHGDRILWEENFSSCEVVPKTIRIIQGTAECVEFQNKIWLASIKGWTKVEKHIHNWNLSKDWSLEFTVHLRNGNEAVLQELHLFIGNEKSPLFLIYRADKLLQVNKRNLPAVQSNGVTHTIGLMKIGDTVHVFVDGNRWSSVPVETVSLARLKGRVLIELGPGDIEKGSYAFITNLKVSQFSK